MLKKILVGSALLALGFYVGREIGRTEPARRKLEEARRARRLERLPSPGQTEETS